MPPTVAELLRALPEETEGPETLRESPAEWSFRPVPVGRWRRLRLLGTLQAKIAAAYFFYWLRGWFTTADERERLLAETHWKTALRLLDSMGYLRGAVMKVGQTLANFPDIAPPEFVETLDRLYFDAPPMHWSLLREMARNELGDDPDAVFASFDKQAFAAASFGQVHRARLKSGEEVAVKIQYPGIARAVREDFRNFNVCLLTGRLNRDWQSAKDQFEDLRARLERETDYSAEARVQEKVRALFREDDGIVVPWVHPSFSTPRVLTMERLDGVHIDQFMARNPGQEERNRVAIQILRAWYRMMYAGRISYADLHPGNFLVLGDGRLGVIDFGFVIEHNDEEWAVLRRMDRALTTGRREDRVAAVKEWSSISDDPADADRLRLTEEYADWCWRSRYHGGPYDFGDEADFRRGIDLFTEMVRKRYTRSRSSTAAIARMNFGVRSILYRLKAKIDLRPIAEEEVKATGWDRSDYAGD
ncbi:MAG TPA: AarF/ABC1/UbiB kinase family protein [Gemmataceae bacterium]|jgi:predicted unusual protein kinase regulating ubiquinone biosynthesis (AarF/ABC1/UbiB family)|nr:AarF/ABC1/UbiB kinase family protein [Gemmataceae bacterium]